MSPAQTTYSPDRAPGFAGQLVGIGNPLIRSGLALAAIAFGCGLAIAAAGNNAVRLPQVNDTDVTFSADLVTSNVINGSVTVTDKDGVSTTTALSATTFASTHAATMGVIAGKIAALTGVASAVVGDANNRTITVKASGDNAVALSGFVVTLGGSQATAAYAERTTDVFTGVALHQHKPPATINGAVRYEAAESVDVLEQGDAYVYVEGTVKESDPVYLRYRANGTGKDPGQFRADSDSGRAVLVTGVRFAAGRTGAGIVALRVNRP
jgi:hypothetical protein